MIKIYQKYSEFHFAWVVVDSIGYSWVQRHWSCPISAQAAALHWCIFYTSSCSRSSQLARLVLSVQLEMCMQTLTVWCSVCGDYLNFSTQPCTLHLLSCQAWPIGAKYTSCLLMLCLTCTQGANSKRSFTFFGFQTGEQLIILIRSFPLSSFLCFCFFFVTVTSFKVWPSSIIGHPK